MSFSIKLSFSFFFIISFLQGQDIKGLWMKEREPNVMSIPFIEIVEIKQDSIIVFDFNTLYSSHPVSFNDSEISYRDTILASYSFVNNDIFNSTTHYGGVKSDTIPSFRFLRLSPTIDKENLVDSIKTFNYKVEFNGYLNKIIFGRKLDFSEFIHLEENNVIANQIFLNKWRGIYFLSFYLNDNHFYAFPIKEINSDSFILYGVPGEKSDIIVKKIGLSSRHYSK